MKTEYEKFDDETAALFREYDEAKWGAWEADPRWSALPAGSRFWYVRKRMGWIWTASVGFFAIMGLSVLLIKTDEMAEVAQAEVKKSSAASPLASSGTEFNQAYISKNWFNKESTDCVNLDGDEYCEVLLTEQYLKDLETICAPDTSAKVCREALGLVALENTMIVRNGSEVVREVIYQDPKLALRYNHAQVMRAYDANVPIASLSCRPYNKSYGYADKEVSFYLGWESPLKLSVRHQHLQMPLFNELSFEAMSKQMMAKGLKLRVDERAVSVGENYEMRDADIWGIPSPENFSANDSFFMFDHVGKAIETMTAIHYQLLPDSPGYESVRQRFLVDRRTGYGEAMPQSTQTSVTEPEADAVCEAINEAAAREAFSRAWWSLLGGGNSWKTRFDDADFDWFEKVDSSRVSGAVNRLTKKLELQKAKDAAESSQRLF